MKLKRTFYTEYLVAVIAFTLIDMIAWGTGFWLTAPLYNDSRYYGVWSEMMTQLLAGTVQPGSVTCLIFTVVTILFAVLFVGGYVFLRDALKGSPVRKGVTYAMTAFAVGGLYAFLGLGALVYLPWQVLVSWIVIMGIDFAVQGVVVGKIMQKRLK